jgi:hypothetical protein
MKTMRILALGIMALALALASGSAEALLVLKVEDPALTDGVFQVEDNGDRDFNLLEGMIATAIDDEICGRTLINAISSQDETAPRLVLDLEGYCSLSDSITFSLTDTDFVVNEGTPGQATVFGNQGAGNVASFTFSGDGDNQPFEPGFTITTGSVSQQREIIAAQDVTVAAVGSLTLSGVVEKGGSVEDLLAGTFTMILQIGESAEINCPPNILGQTVSRLGKVEDGCVIQDSIIEDGDVQVNDVAGFSIVNSKVRNGNINIENVSGLLTVDRNEVTNGDIEIKKTDTPRVTRNIVNGDMTINENHNPRVARNVFSNGDMIVRDNTGRTAVVQNIGLGTANLEVDKNPRAVVRNNTTNRDISCKENAILKADGNEADRRVECPKEEDGGLFD